MKYKGVIFDFNGVIIDDFQIQRKAWSKILKLLSGKVMTSQEYARLRGMTVKDTLHQVANTDQFSEKEIDKLVKKRQMVVKDIYRTGSPSVFPKGLVSLLENLTRKGIPRTIATSATSDMMQFYFRKLNLNRWFSFDQIVTNDGSHKGKPEPDVYLLASEMLGLQPAFCVVFEDAISGIIAAHRAGIGKIIAVDTQGLLKNLQNLPDVEHIIHDFTEIDLETIFS